MHTDKSQRANVSPYFDWSFRWGKVIGEKFAFKIGAQLIQAKDWLARDSTNYARSGTSGKVKAGTRLTDPNYDGVNVYGDETSQLISVLSFRVQLLANPGLGHS